MREWYLVLVPVVAIVYFTLFPDQFSALIAWAANYVH
jgi:hypothetical protein